MFWIWTMLQVNMPATPIEKIVRARYSPHDTLWHAKNDTLPTVYSSVDTTHAARVP